MTDTDQTGPDPGAITTLPTAAVDLAPALPALGIRVDPPTIPQLSAIPREDDAGAARRTVTLAAEMRASVEEWAPRAVAARDFVTAADVRRAVAGVADVITKRGLSRPATLDAQVATRAAERVLGMTIRAGQRDRLIRSRGELRAELPAAIDFAGTTVALERCLRLGDVTEETFVAAVDTCTEGGSCAYDSFVGGLGEEGRSAAENARREHLVALAVQGLTSGQIGERMKVSAQQVRTLARRWAVEIPGDKATSRNRQIDVGRVVEESLATLEGVAASVKLIPVESIDEMDPADAGDLARAMWTALVPIMHVQKAAANRGRKA